MTWLWATDTTSRRSVSATPSSRRTAARRVRCRRQGRRRIGPGRAGHDDRLGGVATLSDEEIALRLAEHARDVGPRVGRVGRMAVLRVARVDHPVLDGHDPDGLPMRGDDPLGPRSLAIQVQDARPDRRQEPFGTTRGTDLVVEPAAGIAGHDPLQRGTEIGPIDVERDRRDARRPPPAGDRPFTAGSVPAELVHGRLRDDPLIGGDGRPVVAAPRVQPFDDHRDARALARQAVQDQAEVRVHPAVAAPVVDDLERARPGHREDTRVRSGQAGDPRPKLGAPGADRRRQPSDRPGRPSDAPQAADPASHLRCRTPQPLAREFAERIGDHDPWTARTIAGFDGPLPGVRTGRRDERRPAPRDLDRVVAPRRRELGQDPPPDHQLVQVPADGHPDPEPPCHPVDREPLDQPRRGGPRVETLEGAVDEVGPGQDALDHGSQREHDRSVVRAGRPPGVEDDDIGLGAGRAGLRGMLHEAERPPAHRSAAPAAVAPPSDAAPPPRNCSTKRADACPSHAPRCRAMNGS